MVLQVRFPPGPLREHIYGAGPCEPRVRGFAGVRSAHNFVECQYTFRLPVRSTSTNRVSALKTSSDRF